MLFLTIVNTILILLNLVFSIAIAASFVKMVGYRPQEELTTQEDSELVDLTPTPDYAQAQFLSSFGARNYDGVGEAIDR